MLSVRMGRLFFFAAILLFGHPPRIVASPDSEYLAKCTVNSTIEVICEMSFFSSHRNYDLTGQLYVDIGNDLCNLEIARQNVLGRSTGATILAVKRGGCAFDTKAIVAQALNFKALAIINFESTTFPAGSQDPNFQTKIPVVMVSSEFWTLVDLERESTATGEREREECAELSMTIKYGNAKATKSPHKSPLLSAEQLHSAGWCVLVVCLLAIILQFCGKSLSSSSRIAAGAAGVTLCLALVSSFLFLRLGTLRTTGTTADGTREFDHNETDEKIFEALVFSLSRDWKDYRLTNEVIARYGLAKENYGDSIFIHPPIFVGFLAVAHRVMGDVAIPLVPVLMQLATLLLIPVIVRRVTEMARGTVDEDEAVEGQGPATWSCAIFSFCPIAMFVSQKVWIDNGLLLTVSAAATAHLTVCVWLKRDTSQMLRDGDGHEKRGTGQRKGHRMGISRACALHFASGLFFGAIALNTKVTALALLPFLFIWTLWANTLIIVEDVYFLWSWQELVSAMGRCSIQLICLCVGAAMGHAPWVWLYWSHTGRLLPNAWPSADMVRRSRFLQAALSKPLHTYVSTLLRLSPLHVCGLAFAVLALPLSVHRIKRSTDKRIYKVDTDQRNSDKTTAAEGESAIVRDEMAFREGEIGAEGPTVRSWILEHRKALSLLFFSSWPLAFVVALTALGYMGAGYQTRFLLPILPATSILAGAALSSDGGSDAAAVGAILLAYASIHCLFYGVMFTPLYADLDDSLMDILAAILLSPYHPPTDAATFQAIFKFMSHFGLARQTT